MADHGMSRESLLALNGVARDTAALFHANEDIEQISKVNSALEGFQAARKREIDTQRELLQTLARQYEAQKAACTRPANAPTEKQHRDRLAQLDQHKFSLGKTIASLEQDISGKEGMLVQVKEDASQVEQLDDIEAYGQDTEVLRLKVYRDLGFCPIADNSHQFHHVLTSSATQGNVHSVSLAGAGSPFALANKLWHFAA